MPRDQYKKYRMTLTRPNELHAGKRREQGETVWLYGDDADRLEAEYRAEALPEESKRKRDKPAKGQPGEEG